MRPQTEEILAKTPSAAPAKPPMAHRVSRRLLIIGIGLSLLWGVFGLQNAPILITVAVEQGTQIPEADGLAAIQAALDGYGAGARLIVSGHGALVGDEEAVRRAAADRASALIAALTIPAGAEVVERVALLPQEDGEASRAWIRRAAAATAQVERR